MSIATQIIAQRDFSGGQLDEAAKRRDDVDIMRAGLRRARNVRILNTGSVTRRPGRRVLFSTDGLTYEIRPAPGDPWFLVLEDERAILRFRDLSATQTFSGMPWSAEVLADLRFVENAGTVIVAGPDMRPQVFSYTRGTRTWSHQAFAFSTDVTGAIRQPFYNFFLGSGITLLPSARTGSISITFSDDVLDPAHVGRPVQIWRPAVRDHLRFIHRHQAPQRSSNNCHRPFN